jgi:hypothetical protein
MKKLLLCFALIFAGNSACYAQNVVHYVPVQNTVPVVTYVPVVSSVVVTNWVPVVTPVIQQYPLVIVQQPQRYCWFHRNYTINVPMIPAPIVRYTY